MSLKSILKAVPVFGPALAAAVRRIKPAANEFTPPPIPFEHSESYWEQRYAAGGNSGSGAYNHLAKYKAEIVNEFVDKHEMTSVIEFGSGDGNQLSLARYPNYTGVDVSPTVIAKARAQFADDPSIRFIHTSELTPDTKADLSISLDVIYHLVEDDVFDLYMRRLFDAARKAVIIYASNEDKGWKDPHVRHRKFTDWIEKNRPDFIFMSRVPNRYPYDAKKPDDTSFSDHHIFRSVDWRP